MLDDNVKTQKMVEIAKMYYEEDLTQNEIAKRLGVSRPLVSKMLADAKEAGIVTIQINSPFVSNDFLMEEIKKKYNIEGGMVIPQADTDYLTDQVILNNVISYMSNDLKKYRKFGLGWGKNIGDLVQKLEVSEKKMELEGYVCPLVGNISMPTKDFHSNELVRIFSQMTFLKPYYLFAPAFLATEQEKNLFINIENYKDIKRLWEKLDVAVLSIGNHHTSTSVVAATPIAAAPAAKPLTWIAIAIATVEIGEIINTAKEQAIKIHIKTGCNSVNVLITLPIAEVIAVTYGYI